MTVFYVGMTIATPFFTVQRCLPQNDPPAFHQTKSNFQPSNPIHLVPSFSYFPPPSSSYYSRYFVFPSPVNVQD